MENLTISLVMIVKNESHCLSECLDSVHNQVDEIVIVDTGSTDQTIEIARRYTSHIYSYTWQDDFSAARNFALQKATGNWILSLDADEKLLPGTGSLKELVAAAGSLEAYLLPLHYPINMEQREYNHFLVLRFFKNNGRYFFQGKIHEQIVVPQENLVGVAAGPIIQHRQLLPSERNRKRSRNLDYLKKACAAEPDNPFLQYYLGVEWLALGKPLQALPRLEAAWKHLPESHLMFRSPALRYLILALRAAGRLEEAFCLCMEADLKYPLYTDIYYLGGLILEEKQEYYLAIKWFEQAVSCGSPPPEYSHLHGTESFLAYYHLGYCYEKLGNRQEAALNYEKALKSNPQYIYPLYQLFLLTLAQKGPSKTLEYLQQQGYLTRSTYAFAAAELFLLAGYPQFSWHCVKPFLRHPLQSNWHSQKPDENNFSLGKYSFLTGHFKVSRHCLSKIEEKSSFFFPAQICCALSLLLEGNTAAARAVLLKLWKKSLPAQRAEIFLLLRLSRTLENPGLSLNKEKTVFLPLQVGETSTADAVARILELLSSCLPANAFHCQQLKRFSNLFGAFLSLIKTALPGGPEIIKKYYWQKYQQAKAFFTYKFELEEEVK